MSYFVNRDETTEGCDKGVPTINEENPAASHNSHHRGQLTSCASAGHNEHNGRGANQRF